MSSAGPNGTVDAELADIRVGVYGAIGVAQSEWKLQVPEPVPVPPWLGGERELISHGNSSPVLFGGRGSICPFEMIPFP